MVSFGWSAARLRTATALAALAAGGAALAQAQAPAPAPAQVQPPPSQQPAQAAPPPAPPPAPVARQVWTTPPGPAKPAVNQAIRDAIHLDRKLAGRLTEQQGAIRRAVDAFYASRGDAPVWLDQGHWTPQAQSAFEQLGRAPEDGLDLGAYRVFSLGSGPDSSLALGDVALSEAVAAYAFQASGGRIDPARISKMIGARPTVVSAEQALAETSRSADAGATLQAYNPRQPGYLALKEQLADARARPARTARLALNGRARAISDETTGALRATKLEGELLVNMEFWRWLPRDLGAERIMVNVPEFTARLYRDNRTILTVRVITGKPDKPTPLFSDKIQQIIVNPSWNVPQSIIRNEMLPHLAALREQGYEIRTVNGRLHIRQPPGERNALGQIKFVFPNDYAVYMHDTPTRRLFATSRRAYSHGCVRVDQPFKLAEELLQPQNGWDEERIRKMVGPHERWVKLTQPVPIHIVYFTAAVDDSGHLRQFDDIYGYDRKAREALGLGGNTPNG